MSYWFQTPCSETGFRVDLFHLEVEEQTAPLLIWLGHQTVLVLPHRSKVEDWDQIHPGLTWTKRFDSAVSGDQGGDYALNPPLGSQQASNS